MGCCGLPAGIGALACLLAERVPDDDELALLAAVFTQLGDSLALIAVQRAVCESRKRECDGA